jgi:hypothetical protein
VVAGRCVLYRERFENFRHYAARYSWKKCVLDATGIDPEYETMVRHPAVHPRWVYAQVRKVIRDHTGHSPETYILSCSNAFPQTFAEFPAIGAVVIKHFPGAYHFVDFTVTNPDGSYTYQHGRDKVKAFWSHGGIDPVINELEEIVK